MPDQTERTATVLSQSVELALTGQPDTTYKYGMGTIRAAGSIRPERVVFYYLDDRINAHLYGVWVHDNGHVTDHPVDQLYRHDEDWPDWLTEMARKHDPRTKAATDQTERLERGRAQLIEAMSAVSEDRTCCGWTSEWARTLHAEGGIWETLGRAVGWPTGNYDQWVWVSWDEAAALYATATATEA
jgi:hypothetical protein